MPESFEFKKTKAGEDDIGIEKNEEADNFRKYLKESPEEAEKNTPDIGIDFHALLDDLEKLKNIPQINEQEIINLIDKLGEEEKVLLINRIKAKICEELKDFANFKAYEEAIKLAKPKFLGKFLNRFSKNAATYYELTGGIRVQPDLMPDNGRLLKDLALAGYNHATYLLHHEYIHKLQGSEEEKNAIKIKIIETILEGIAVAGLIVLIDKSGVADSSAYMQYAYGLPGLYASFQLRNVKDREKVLLRETQAFRGSEKYSASANSNFDLMEKFSFGYGRLLRNRKDDDKFIMANLEVKRLYALGLLDEEIGKLVNEAKWDDKELGFDGLEDKIKQIMAERGLEEEDVDNLVLADEIKREIYIRKVRMITQELLKEAGGVSSG